tara:strand:- start:94 stop:654 length:561 start_codon:yes stop_codon:yes gene_type:complete
VIIGIAGCPGSGKSTLAIDLVERLGPIACHVPMDGFHLSNGQLSSLGRQGTKGAPDTFDSRGYVQLLSRIASEGEDVYAPDFSRDIDNPIAASICVSKDKRIIVTEGNYLLLGLPIWQDVRHLLDEAWYLDMSDQARIAQLIQRHQEFGKSLTEAEQWVRNVDDKNAQLVSQNKQEANLVIWRNSS